MYTCSNWRHTGDCLSLSLSVYFLRLVLFPTTVVVVEVEEEEGGRALVFLLNGFLVRAATDSAEASN